MNRKKEESRLARENHYSRLLAKFHFITRYTSTAEQKKSSMLNDEFYGLCQVLGNVEEV